MKAKEAPEKLYIDFRDRAESTWRCAYTEKALANDIEYVRKDAFIEKACEWLQGFMECSSLFEYEVSESEKKKVIEDFEKYMKGK